VRRSNNFAAGALDASTAAIQAAENEERDLRNISSTIARLSALRTRQERAGNAGIQDRLSDLQGFGSNPGALRGRFCIPGGLLRAAPLVVVLHGCTQTAAGYDHGSGWSRLADQEGFAVLFPEQMRSNNGNLCFNWFEPSHTRRDSGEVLSIRQMIQSMVADHDLDGGRVFITGLSAGGAMTSAMLATYPEVFVGGAIIAGLPYGSARTVAEAFDRMRGYGGPSGPRLQQLLRNASSHDGPWPTISVWHGTADSTVASSNADAIVGQWSAVHELDRKTRQAETVDDYERRVWREDSGRTVIEEYRIAGMGHGTPLATAGDLGLGAGAPFMLDIGISSTRLIAQFWGIAKASASSSAKIVKVKTETEASPAGSQATRKPKEGISAARRAMAYEGKLVHPSLRTADSSSGIRGCTASGGPYALTSVRKGCGMSRIVKDHETRTAVATAAERETGLWASHAR
jgi:poly(hydroxyalkanoate) depolymerase family esterase